MERPWCPLTAGILDIISGIWALCWVFVLALGGGITSIVSDVPQWVPTLLFGLAIPFALAGSISAFFCCFILGIVSIILVAISHHEFK